MGGTLNDAGDWRKHIEVGCAVGSVQSLLMFRDASRVQLTSGYIYSELFCPIEGHRRRLDE